MARDVNVQAQERDACAHMYKTNKDLDIIQDASATTDSFLNEITF
jgi:hypothetical protein